MGTNQSTQIWDQHKLRKPEIKESREVVQQVQPRQILERYESNKSEVHKKEEAAEKPTISYIDLSQFQKIYDQSSSDFEKFFQIIETYISDLYISLSKKTLELMGEKKLSSNQAKIYISEQVLHISLNILKTVSFNNNFKYDPNVINKLNSLQLSMIGYMKAKYPRQAQNLVADELMKSFRNIDFVEQPENDVLRSLKIHFGDESQVKLMRTVKVMFNKLIDQIDDKFPIFQQILSQKVFVVTKEGTQYTVNNKISRKIPENVEKFVQDDSISIDLKNSELFRVIVKWVNDMQDYILHPDDELKEKDHFKTVNITEQSIKFDFISIDELEDYLGQLQVVLNEEKEVYEKQLDGLKQYIQKFNHNLLRILTKASLKQKYVPRKQAQIIKYSMFNRRILSWMVIEKLKKVLKNLIKTSERLESRIGRKLDLIKFNVTDLLRAMMTGNKFEIIKVFNNLRALEEEKVIKILKIKNRFQTPLNDAIVIFKMSGSFILCQLQVIMSDSSQSGSEKLKNIQILNHFFYEIQRSPYGVMAQLAALLSFKDSKIEYEKKLNFNKLKQDDVEQCMKGHQEKVQKKIIQDYPFICSKCTEYNSQYTSQYSHKVCNDCVKYLCSKCIVEQNTDLQSSERSSKMKQFFHEKIKQSIKKHEKSKKSEKIDTGITALEQYSNKTQTQQFFGIVVKKVVPIRQFSSNKAYTTIKEIKNYILGDQVLQKQIYNSFIQGTNQQIFYFAIGKYINKTLNLYSMKYDSLNGVRFSFNYKSPSKIQFRYFDFLIFYGFKSHRDEKKNLASKIPINLFVNFPTVQLQNEYYYYYQVTQPLILILDIQEINQPGITEYLDFSKKQFKYESIEQYRSNIPNLKQTHENMNLTTLGLQQKHLEYFNKVEWKAQVKVLNLHDNKIKDILVILDNLTNLQNLIISRNYLSEIKFTKKFGSLKKLNASSNTITLFQGIENIPNIVTLNFSSNELNEFLIKGKSLKHLRNLDIQNNPISQIESLTQQDCPNLSYLFVSGSRNQTQCQLQLSLPNLTHLQIRMLSLKSIDLTMCQNLEVLILKELVLKKLVLKETKNLNNVAIISCNSFVIQEYHCSYSDDQSVEQQVKIDEKQYDFFLDNLSMEYPELNQLKITSSWVLKQIPVLKMIQLQNLEIAGIQIGNIDNLSKSNLPNLKSLVFTSIPLISSLPVLNLPEAQIVTFNCGQLLDVKNVSLWDIPKIKEISLTTLGQDVQIPSFQRFSNLSKLQLRRGKFMEGGSIKSQNIETLFIQNTHLLNLKNLSLMKLKKLQFFQCREVQFDVLSISKLPQLESINADQSVGDKVDKILPLLNFPKLKTIYLPSNGIMDITNFARSELPFLEKLDLSSNQISIIPKLSFPKLYQLILSNSKVNDIRALSESNIPELKSLSLSANGIKFFPILSMDKLQYLNISYNQLQTIQNIALSQFPELISFSANGGLNKITKFPAMKLPKLTDLSMEITLFRDINEFSNSSLKSLKNFRFAQLHESITALPRLDLPSLEALELNGSKFKNIESLGQSNLPSVTTADFSFLQVAQLPVLKMKSLQSLTWRSSQQHKRDKITLSSINNLELSDLPKVTCFIFQINKIKELPLMNFPSLQSIYIQENEITKVSNFKKSNLPKLSRINIYENPLNQLPIGKLVKPKQLYMKKAQSTSFKQLLDFASVVQHLYYNQSKFIDKWPQVQFKNLQILQLEKCQLKVIDEIFQYPFFSVKQLSLVDNQIERVPKMICPSLERLFLNRNCIQNVDQFVKSQLPNATMISLESNQISSLPDFPFKPGQIYLSHNLFDDVSFFSKHIYTGLKLLVLWDIKIKKLGKLNAPSVEKIYMNGNLIQSLKGMIGSYLPNCTLLQLSDNRITDISPLSEMSLNQLKTLYIKNNKVVKLGKLTKCPNLYLIAIEENPIQNVDEFCKERPLLLTNLTYSVDGSKELKQKIEDQIKKLNIYSAYMYDYVQKID